MVEERIVMTVTHEVTPSQALALQAFYECWNSLASMGSSRMVAFYVDGDGNFKPKTTMSFSEPVPELTDELRRAAMVEDGKTAGDIKFDFDPIAWRINHPEIDFDKPVMSMASAVPNSPAQPKPCREYQYRLSQRE